MDALGDGFTHRVIRFATDVSTIPWNEVAAVVFTGGADIDPAFYGRKSLSTTYTNSAHDVLDRAVLEAVRGKPIVKLGTCRGAQLLWADQGGVLHQHIPNHGRTHGAELMPLPYNSPLARGEVPATARDWVELDARELERAEGAPSDTFTINSLHHQACNWDSWDKRRDNWPPKLLMMGDSGGQLAVEAWACPQTGCYGFQYHPEWLSDKSLALIWTKGLVREAMGLSADNGYLYPKLTQKRVDLHEQSTA